METLTKQTQSVIEVTDLFKRYGTLTAVDGVNFHVRPGEIFGLLGPNGAGKTTTMEMIEGLRKPDGGTARIAGFDTQTSLRKVKEVIGVQLQSTSLFELLKVKEIMTMYASFYKDAVEIEPLLKDMLLTEKRDVRVKHLSGGQKQRLAIALALVNQPQVVFLDEPTTGLDPQARRTLWDIILKMKEREITIVLSTHYMDEAHVLCDRICLMDRGEIIALDTPENLVNRLQSDSAIQFRLLEVREDQEEFVKEMEGLRNVSRVEERSDTYVLYTDHIQPTLIDFVRLAERETLSFTDLQTRTPTLEDVFLHMTGRSLREE